MSAHFRSEEFVEHLDGVLAPDRERHLKKCDHCQARLAEWLTLAEAIREVGVVPEPSPLFWDHFSERVQDATAAEPLALPAWWRRGWVQLGAMAGVAVALMLAINLQPPAPSEVEGRNLALRQAQGGELADVAFEIDSASWDFVTDLASSIPFEELRQATGPNPGATDDMVAQLTSAERAELVRLVKLDKGIGE